MKEILVINPRPKRRKSKRKQSVKRTKRSVQSTKKRINTMAGKKRGRKRTTTKPKTRTRTKTITKYKYRAKPRRNPSSARRIASAGAGRAGASLMGLISLRNIFNAAQQTTGMLATQFAAKKWGGPGGGANDQNWTPKHYLMGGLGALGSGFIAEMIKRGSGKQMFTGGIALLGFNLVTKTGSSNSEFISDNFGASDDNTVFLGTDGQSYVPGDEYMGDDGEVYIMGADGEWQDGGYLTEPGNLGESLTPPGSLGESLTPPGSLGMDPYARALGSADPYARTFS